MPHSIDRDCHGWDEVEARTHPRFELPATNPVIEVHSLYSPIGFGFADGHALVVANAGDQPSSALNGTITPDRGSVETVDRILTRDQDALPVFARR